MAFSPEENAAAASAKAVTPLSFDRNRHETEVPRQFNNLGLLAPAVAREAAASAADAKRAEDAAKATGRNADGAALSASNADGDERLAADHRRQTGEDRAQTGRDRTAIETVGRAVTEAAEAVDVNARATATDRRAVEAVGRSVADATEGMDAKVTRAETAAESAEEDARAAAASAEAAALFDPSSYYAKAASDERFAPKAHSHVVADVTGLQDVLDAKAPLDSPALAGAPRAPTFASSTNSSVIATTNHVKLAMRDAAANGSQISAPNRPAGDGGTDAANTAFVQREIGARIATKADLASPIFTGTPRAPTPASASNDTSIATTAFVKAQGGSVPAKDPTFTDSIRIQHGSSITSFGADANISVNSGGTFHKLYHEGNPPPAPPAISGVWRLRSFSPDTNYQNATNKPIVINFRYLTGSTSGIVQGYTAADPDSMGSSVAALQGTWNTSTLIVAPGHYFRFTTVGDVQSLQFREFS